MGLTPGQVAEQQAMAEHEGIRACTQEPELLRVLRLLVDEADKVLKAAPGGTKELKPLNDAVFTARMALAKHQPAT